MKLSKITFATASLVAASAANAVILTPGAFTDLPGTVTPGGTVIEDVDQSFSFAAYGGTVSGFVQNRVVRKGDGTLFFAWRMFNDAASSGNIQDLRLGNFISSVYDGDWDPSSPGDISPPKAFLFNGTGGDVNFNFNKTTFPGGVAPGQSSNFFYLNTGATLYGQVAQYDLTNMGQTEISGEYATFAPVPEPATFAVVGIGILALTRRKRKS